MQTASKHINNHLQPPARHEGKVMTLCLPDMGIRNIIEVYRVSFGPLTLCGILVKVIQKLFHRHCFQ